MRLFQFSIRESGMRSQQLYIYKVGDRNRCQRGCPWVRKRHRSQGRIFIVGVCRKDGLLVLKGGLNSAGCLMVNLLSCVNKEGE